MADSPSLGWPPRGAREWADYYARGTLALERRFAEQGALEPRMAAMTVARALPRDVGAWLLHHLRRLGWLSSRAVIPADVLDGPACPPDFRGPPRAVARLAVFGLPGQGVPYREKHRQDIYQQLCAQIMSSAVDDVSLKAVAARAMNHPDVSADSVLASMVRSFIAQREAALRSRLTPGEQQAQADDKSKLRRAFDATYAGGFPTKESLRASFSRLQREFESHVAQFEELRARQMLDRMRLMRQRFPVHLASSELQRAEEQLDQLLKRAGTYRRQLRTLAEQGAGAARTGDQVTANWVLRRLHAVHTVLPNLLPEPELEALSQSITRSGAEHDLLEVRAEFRERQREIATRIKSLTGVVHTFHQLSLRLPHTDDAYRHAETAYRRALDEIRTMNTDWLSGLVLQLESLLDDLDDPTGEMQSQCDKFIASVRTAVNRLCLEIRAFQKPKVPPGPGPDAPPPPD